MTRRRKFAHTKQMTIVNGALVFAVLIVVLQLWLLTATMNAFLGGDMTTAVPAALVSAACLGVNLWLLSYIYRLD